MKKTYKVLITLLLAGTAILGIAALAHQRSLSEDTYYLPAEVVSSQAGVTIFGQVDGEQPTNYVYSVSGTYPDGVPYLLTMDGPSAYPDRLISMSPTALPPQTTQNTLPRTAYLLRSVFFCCTQTAPVSCWGPSLPR